MNLTTEKMFRFAVIAVLFAFAGISIAAAQDTEPAEPAPENTAAWIAWLSESFAVEAAILQTYVEDGYPVMDLRFALELSAASGRTLDEVLEIADGMTGRGWGVIARALGVDPGSEAFHAIRQAHRPGLGLEPDSGNDDAPNLDMAMEQNRWRNREHEGDPDEGQGNRQGLGGNPDRGGPGGPGGPGGKEGSGGTTGPGGR